jgi:hypothetical protein
VQWDRVVGPIALDSAEGDLWPSLPPVDLEGDPAGIGFDGLLQRLSRLEREREEI